MGKLAEETLTGTLPPDDPLSHVEFARTIRLPSGTKKGQRYDPNSDPCQRFFLEQLDAGRYRKFVGIAPPQKGGKTVVCVMIPTLRHVIEMRGDAVYAMPTMKDLDKKWTGGLSKMIRGSGYRSHLPAYGPGSRGGRGPSVQFKHPGTGAEEGAIYFTAANAYGDTASLAIIDELGQFRLHGEKDINAIENIEARTAAFDAAAKAIATGTIEHDDDCVTLYYMSLSTHHVPWPKCPHCSKHQRITWDLVKFEKDDKDTAKKTARIACKNCGSLWDNDDRVRAMHNALFVPSCQTVSEAGEIVGASSTADRFGLHWNALESVLIDLQDVVGAWWDANEKLEDGDHELMRKFYRYRLCQYYTADLNDAPRTITASYLASRSRSAKYNRGKVPGWVIKIIIGVDVQQDRLYWSAIGVGAQMQWCVIDWGYEYGECEKKQVATREQRHDQLEIINDIALRGWIIEDTETTMQASKIVVDVGYQPDDIEAYTKGKSLWRNCRGQGDDEIKEDKKPGKSITKRAGWYEMAKVEERKTWWLFVDSRSVIKWMHESLLKDRETPGSGDIPRKDTGEPMRANEGIILHITATVWEQEQKKEGSKIPKYKWVKKNASRHDWRDTIKYALAEARYEEDKEKQRGKQQLKVGYLGDINGGASDE